MTDTSHPPPCSWTNDLAKDVGQILLDNGSTLRELWAGTNPPWSGSMPKGMMLKMSPPARPFSTHLLMVAMTSSYQTMISRMTSPESKDSPGPSSSFAHPPSQPSSLPIYAPMSLSPISPDCVSPPIKLNISSGTAFTSQQCFSSPSDSGLFTGTSPPCSQLKQQLVDAQYRTSGNNSHSSQQQLSHCTIYSQ